jgi:phytoene dehydrogenase-like protein
VTACHLVTHGLETLVIDSAPAIGGRLASSRVGGFLIDEGFPLFHTADPECQAVLDTEGLDLGRFAPGMLLRAGGADHRIVPSLSGLGGTERIPGRLGSRADLAALGRRLRRLAATPVERLALGTDHTVMETYTEQGLSESVMAGFVRRYLMAFAHDADPRVSARAADLMFRQLVRGRWALPAAGMAAIPRQLAGCLPEGTIRLGTPALSVSADRVSTETGDVRAKAVVVATDPTTALRLLPGLREPAMCSVTTFHHVIRDATSRPARPRSAGPVVIVDGELGSPVARTAMLSDAAPSYAPAGASLVATNVVDDHLGRGVTAGELEAVVRDRLAALYGIPADAFETFAIRRHARAVPAMRTPHNFRRPVRLLGGLYVAGDHREAATIDGALASGRRAAHALLGDLGIEPIPFSARQAERCSVAPITTAVTTAADEAVLPLAL